MSVGEVRIRVERGSQMGTWFGRLALAAFVVLATTGWGRRAAAYTVSDPLPEPDAWSSAGMSAPDSGEPWRLWSLENDPGLQPWNNLLPYGGASTSAPTPGGPASGSVSAVVGAEQLPPPPTLVTRLFLRLSQFIPDPPAFRHLRPPRCARTVLVVA